MSVGGGGFEDEDLGGEVGVDVVGAHEGQDGAAGEVFDRGDAVGAHGVLIGAAHVEHLLGAVAVGEVALAGRERVLEHDDDQVAVDRGARLGRSAAGVVGQEPDDRLGDRCVEGAAFEAGFGGVVLPGHDGLRSRLPRKVGSRARGGRRRRTGRGEHQSLRACSRRAIVNSVWQVSTGRGRAVHGARGRDARGRDVLRLAIAGDGLRSVRARWWRRQVGHRSRFGAGPREPPCAEASIGPRLRVAVQSRPRRGR